VPKLEEIGRIVSRLPLPDRLHKVFRPARPDSEVAPSSDPSLESDDDRNRLQSLIPVAVLVVGAILAVSYLRSLPAPHLTVEVVNDTESPLADLRFTYSPSAPVQETPRLTAGGMIAWTIRGQAKGFTLAYRDADGRLVTRTCDVYCDGDDFGTMSLHVKKGGLKVVTEVDANAKRPKN
jgi:hypothetical protein